MPGYFLVVLPEFLLAALACGVVLGVRDLAGRRTDPFRPAGRLLLILASVGPLAAAVVLRTPVYDTVRHFLFLVPFLCSLAALAACRIWREFIAGRRPRRMAAALLLAAGALYYAGILVRLHPYESVYYNVFAGGLKGAEGWYEIDYWGASLRESALWLANHTRTDGADASSSYAVNVCGNAMIVLGYLPANFHLTMNPEEADFVIAYTRYDCAPERYGTAVHSVTRDGVTLSTVYARSR